MEGRGLGAPDRNGRELRDHEQLLQFSKTLVGVSYDFIQIGWQPTGQLLFRARNFDPLLF